ncbi:MAG TPA: hypothetical protein VGF55_24690 [Gemmataceae bacterium]|jgi:hypothetical protein
MSRVLAVITATFLAATVAVRAADAPKPAGDQGTQKDKQQAAFEQERLRREFSAFQQSLLTLAQRYEKSAKPEDREKALVLRQAIDLAAKEGVDNQFNKLVATLTASGISLQDINAAIGQNQQLTRTLREMIDILLTDNQTAKLKEEQRRLQDLLKQLEKVIREQKLERSKTESGRLDGAELAKSQGKVTDQTKKLSKDMGNGKNAKDAKGEAKGAGKDGKPKVEGKDDTKQAKGDPKGGDPKKGDKDAKGEQQAKGGEPKGGKPGEAEAKGGEPKDAQGEGKPKPGDPKDSKNQKNDPGENKGKPEGKGEPKPGEGDGEAKGQPKPNQGQPQQGQPQQGQPKGDGQQQDGQPNGQQQPQQPQDEATPGRKQVQDAIENQGDAEKNLKKNDKPKASGDQDEAIKNLEEVRKEIERRLKQLREEELERLLANLEARCRKMLEMQIGVYEGTKRVAAAIQANEGQKASRNEDLKAGELSATEGVIVAEANKALQLLEEDGTAVAVPQVLEQCRDDMRTVQGRLFKTDVGPFTQQVEEEIIAALKEVIEALKKQQQELKDKKDQPPPPGGGSMSPQALINMLAELKMLRSLQVRVNQRTISYGKQTQGEQTDDSTVQGELRKLAERQVKIEKATKDIATGKTAGGQP